MPDSSKLLFATSGPCVSSQVQAPTMLIVGELDGVVIELNAAAHDAMHCEREMVIVPGAGHLFEEPGTLDQVVDHARQWFLKHLGDAA